MNGDIGRNPTSRDVSSQPNQREITSPSKKTQHWDHIRKLYCCTSPTERRLENTKDSSKPFNDEKEKIEEMFDTIPQALATSFKTKIDSLTTEFQESSKRYVTGSKTIRDLSERNMQLTHESLQKMRKELEKDLDPLKSFQKAITEHEQALNSVRQDDQALIREWAKTQIEAAVKKYSLALQSRDPQGYERRDAKEQIKETSSWLKERSLWLKESPEAFKKLGEVQQQIQGMREHIEGKINAPASTSNDTLPHIERSVADKVINDFKQAHLQVLDSYQQSRDTKSLQDACKHFEKAYDRVRTLSKYLNQWNKIHEYKAQLEAAHSEDTPYDKSIKDLSNKAIDTIRNAYQDVLACLQDGLPLRGEDIGDAIRKGADQRFQKACDQLKTLSETSHAYQEARKEHEKALNYYVPQDYQFLARKLAKKREELVMADYRVLLQGDQQGSNWLHAKEYIEETSHWLKERFQPYKKPIENLIEKITSAFSPVYDLEERCRPLDKEARNRLLKELRPAEQMQIRILGTLAGLHKSQLKQFDKDRNGETIPPTRTPDQWRQKFEEISADIDRVSTCFQYAIEKKYNLYNSDHLIGLAIHLLSGSSESPITDKLTVKWEKCCASHDALVICMGDEFKNIDPAIHQEMGTYKKNMESYKERKEKLDKNLGEFKSLLAKARQLEPNAETREFIASIENRSKSALAKAKQLIDDMEAEHEKFKEYLRDRGWLEKDASTNVPASHSARFQGNIASTSGG